MSSARIDAHHERHLDLLAGLPLFSSLSPEDLQRLASVARRVLVPADTLVIEEGGTGDGLHIVLRGELLVSRRDEGRDHVLAVLGPGELVGEMSLVDDSPRSASVRAREETELIVVDPLEFRRLIASSSTAALIIMRTIMGRLRSTEASLRQQAKMAALGTLAAGLAHELNNPASAVQSGVDHLRRALENRELVFDRLRTAGIQPRPAVSVSSDVRVREAEAAADIPPNIDEREASLSRWLTAQGNSSADLLAASLASFGWTPARLESVLEDVPIEHHGSLLEAVAADAAVATILEEIDTASVALTEIVQAVKGYTYLGQAPIQQIDLRQSIEDTLTILRSKLKAGIRVIREIEPRLPPVEGFGSELNQVWTNLIDNAIEAMEGRGTIEIRAESKGGRIVIEFVDSGPGIPPEIRDRVFEPFFTTKAPGAGTGLGLHLAYTSVRKHGGSIQVESRPGRTVFRVVLPLRLPATA
jgi:signal transduction histidine kinase